MKITKFLLLSVIGLLCSCSVNDDSEIVSSESENIEHFTLNAVYKGKNYQVPCVLIEDKDSIIFLDEKFKNIFYNEISKLPNLVCDIKHDGSVEYKNEIIKETTCIKVPENNLIQARGTTGDTYLQFYEKANYKGKSQKITLTYKYRNWQNPNLSLVNWSKNISSIRAYYKDNNITEKVYLLAYDEMLFQGHVLRYELYKSGVEITQHTEVEIPDLSKVPMSGGGNWNDKIVSMKFYY